MRVVSPRRFAGARRGGLWFFVKTNDPKTEIRLSPLLAQTQSGHGQAPQPGNISLAHGGETSRARRAVFQTALTSRRDRAEIARRFNAGSADIRVKSRRDG